MSFIIPAAVVNIFTGSGTALVAAGAEAAAVGAAVTTEVITVLGAVGSAIGAAGAGLRCPFGDHQLGWTLAVRRGCRVTVLGSATEQPSMSEYLHFRPQQRQ